MTEFVSQQTRVGPVIGEHDLCVVTNITQLGPADAAAELFQSVIEKEHFRARAAFAVGLHDFCELDPSAGNLGVFIVDRAGGAGGKVDATLVPDTTGLFQSRVETVAGGGFVFGIVPEKDRAYGRDGFFAGRRLLRIFLPAYRAIDRS